VRLLHENEIGFTVNSSRAAIGLRMLVKPLSLTVPVGAFNGGAIVGPKLELIEQHLVPEPAVRRSVDVLEAFGADVWIFTTNDWLVRNPSGDYVPRERQTLWAEPSVVADFDPYFPLALKIVGSSKDFTMLAKCEAAMREALDEQASIARSQPYYLDVTSPKLDKGTFVERFRDAWPFRRRRLPRWAIWRTISPCSVRRVCRLRWEMRVQR
jgi:hydroxymethylpyrimidine pyrophosphatase-like HAD family hydrolase